MMLDSICTIVHGGQMKETLLTETVALVKGGSVPITKICGDTGLKARWMHKLLSGEFTDPGVNKVERLNKYMKSNRA